LDNLCPTGRDESGLTENQQTGIKLGPPMAGQKHMPENMVLTGIFRQQPNGRGSNFRNCKNKLLLFRFGVHVLVNNE
jgi:hypothetical protein